MIRYCGYCPLHNIEIVIGILMRGAQLDELGIRPTYQLGNVFQHYSTIAAVTPDQEQRTAENHRDASSRPHRFISGMLAGCRFALRHALMP